MMSDVWDKLWWKGSVDTLTDRDILYMVDEIKMEYTLPLVETMEGEISTLEVGSGSGRLSCFLASRGYHTTCLDYSPNALRVAQNNYRLAKNEGIFVMGDAEKLPFLKGSFDVVLSTGLLEHFVDPQLVVNEMARVMKPGGYFISDIVPRKYCALYSSIPRFTRTIVSIPLWMRGVRKHHIYERRVSKHDIKCWLKAAELHDINVFAAGVVPPPLPFSKVIPYRKRAERIYNALSYRLKPFSKLLDDTIIAEWLGLYYFAHAKKPNTADDKTSNL